MNELEVTRLRRVMRAMVELHGKEKTIELWRGALQVRSEVYPYNCQDGASPAQLEIKRALRLEFSPGAPPRSKRQ